MTRIIREVCRSGQEAEDEVIRRVDELARAEHRSRANMLRVLLIEALEARETKLDPVAKPDGDW